MYIVNYLVNGYGKVKRVTDILNNIELVAVPFVNPDGYVVSCSYSIHVATTMVKEGERKNNQSGNQKIVNSTNITIRQAMKL